MTRQNDNHSPGPGPGRLVPSWRWIASWEIINRCSRLELLPSVHVCHMFFSSYWCRVLAAACDCGIPWTFHLTFWDSAVNFLSKLGVSGVLEDLRIMDLFVWSLNLFKQLEYLFISADNTNKET